MIKVFNERSSLFFVKLDSLEKWGVPWDNPITAERVFDNPLGDFTVTEGHDEKGPYISIYDRRDLNPFQKGNGASSNERNSDDLLNKVRSSGYDQVNEDSEVSELFGAGNPFEIYDRIYYNPDTKEILSMK